MDPFFYTMMKGKKIPHASQTPSPTLVYQKFHAYDSFRDRGETKAFDTKESRRAYLGKICELARQAGKNYRHWHEKYIKAIKALGAQNTAVSYCTIWRLVVGMSTNPALETGLCLHHLHGFPYIPGSSVKGLIHHHAEMELMDDSWTFSNEDPDNIPVAKIEKLENKIVEAKRITELFGSLCLESKNSKMVELQTPLSRFQEWFNWASGKKTEALADLAERLAQLTAGEHVGGRLGFFDAVPEPDSMLGKEILQVDILNPHYPDYYGDEEGTTLPTDDQSPNPVYFLAVRPNARFIFPFKLRPDPSQESGKSAKNENVAARSGYNTQETLGLVKKWIDQALSFRGVGAKTSAGYGYFFTSED